MIRMNEYERVKAWREANRKKCQCGVSIAWDTIKCRSCHGKDRSAIADSVTLKELKSKGRYWTAYVRNRAQKIHSFTDCMLCGYNKHVEIAHYPAISKWPLEATVKEVNEVVFGLCPNCHWEFDHGLIDPRRLTDKPPAF